MSRTVWVVAAITTMALCWGTIILGVGSLSVTDNQASLNATLCKIAPEYRLPVDQTTVYERVHRQVARRT